MYVHKLFENNISLLYCNLGIKRANEQSTCTCYYHQTSL